MVLPRLSGLFPFSSPTPSRTLFLLAFDSLTPFCHRLLLSSVFNPTKKITSLSAIHHVHAGSSLHFENPSLFIVIIIIVHRQFHITALSDFSSLPCFLNMTHPSLKTTSRLFIRQPTPFLIRLLCLLFTGSPRDVWPFAAPARDHTNSDPS